MSRCRCTIEFSRLDAATTSTPPAAIGTSVGELRIPGVDLRWDSRRVDVALERGVLAIASGTARDAVADERGEAARWIDRYVQRGDECAENVGGGFAVALVDLRSRRVVLIVDRFSIETLCFRHEPGRFAFASGARDVDGAGPLDAQSLYDYLYFHVIPAPHTAFAGVHRMLPAHTISASAEGFVTRAYWSARFVEDDRSDLRGRERAFRDLVEAAVAREADIAPTACFLSGGTDSSTVAGMLTRIRGEPAHAYSIGFAAEGYDEMHFARVAARHFGLVHHEYYVTPDDVADAVPTIAASLDQPFGNSSLVPAYCCALRARADGVNKMLAGDGGDELFAGNSRYAMQHALELYHRLPGFVRRDLLEPAAERSRLLRGVPLFRQIGGYVRHAKVPMPDRLENFNLLQRLGHETMFEPAFLSRIDATRPPAEQRATWTAIDARSLTNRMLAYDWKYTLADSDLPKVRTATDIAGVRVGYPLLDRALADFSLALPADWKLKRWKLRWFFKNALRDFLPAEILGKKKHGFGLPFGAWAMRHERLRRLAHDSLDGIAERGLVRRAFVRELLDQRMPSAPGYYGEMVWLLMLLEQWLRHAAADTCF